MTIPYGYHEGNRSEYLAAYFLSKIGLVIPVPRQADLFKVDFIVHLSRKKKRNFVPTGRCFAIQIKSDCRPLKIESRNLDRFWESGFPYFIGVISKTTGLKLSVYATLPRLVFMWMVGRNQEFRLKLDGTVEDFHKNEWKDQNDNDVKDVWTGPPILELDAGELEGAKTKNASREMFFSVMESWLDFEASSLAWKSRTIPVVEMPSTFKTNEPASREAFIVQAVANPNSFPTICQAVHAPLFSLGYYLHDLVARASIPQQLKSQANEIDKALKCVKDGVRDLGPKVANSLH